MRLLIEKKDMIFKRLFNAKGQGIVEFAIILALCAGIGVAARNVGVINLLNEVFDASASIYGTAAIGGNSAEPVDTPTTTNNQNDGAAGSGG